MGERVQWPVPFWRMQYELLGGYRRLTAILMICAVALAVGTFALWRFFRQDPFPSVAGWVLNLLTAIQVFVVVLGGSQAVYKAMLRDFQTKMIESHRLTPMSSMTVVLGYLLGSTLQIMALFVLFTVAGAVLSFAAGLPVRAWLYGNLLLLNGAVTIWSVVLFAGLRQQKPFSPAPLIVGIAALTAAFAFVPGAGLLLNVYSVLFGIWMTTGTVPVAAPAAVIVAAINVGMTFFWLSAAAAKYRRPDLPVLHAGRGLVLLAIGVIVGAAGIMAFEIITRTWMRGFFDQNLPQIQWIATMIGALCLAAVPVAGAVKCQTLVARGAAPRNWADRVSGEWTAVIAAVLICLLMAVVGVTVWWWVLPAPPASESMATAYVVAWAVTAAACVLGTLSIAVIYRLTAGLTKSADFLAGLYVLLFWALPPIGDFVRAQSFADYHGGLEYTWLMGCSPVGSIIAAWSDLGATHWPGLLVQLAVLLIAVAAVRGMRTPRPPAV